ncbi:hypothetical protein N185_16315 [Sinorhizobium sp. GW3]|nr:hypothetical protein N185_16315 [Sinorhizobium sp. GW3]
MPVAKPNDSFRHELRAMVSMVDLADGHNNSTIGRNGELVLAQFLNRYLPPQFLARRGKYRRRDGTLSRDYDLMVLDARFPFLSEIRDGSVTAMRHAVLCTVEVKRTIVSKQITTIRKDVIFLQNEFEQIRRRHRDYTHAYWATPRSLAFGFRTATRLKTLADHFFVHPVAWTDLFVMAHDFRDDRPTLGAGAIMRPEGTPCDYVGTLLRTPNPLSDFYAMLVTHSFEILAERAVSDQRVSRIIRSYYGWGTGKDAWKSVPFSDGLKRRSKKK